MLSCVAVPRMRKLLFSLHRYLALIAGVFVAILGVTGSIMAFEPEIDHLFHRKLTYVTPQTKPLSLAEVVGIVTRAFPGEAIRAYNISAFPGMAYQVATTRRAVFVNQYTGEILGTRSGDDSVSRFLGTVHQLHLRLLIHDKSDTGKKIESYAGMAIIFLALSGLYLWWPLKRIRLRSWFDLHNTIGVFSLVVLLILATSGVVIGFDREIEPWLFKITGSGPLPRVPRNSAPHSPDAKPITADQAIEIARAAIPGAAPFVIELPRPNGVFYVRARYPEDLTPGGRSAIVIDQYSGKVLLAQGSRTVPAGARMFILNRAVHTGDVFGMPSKIIASLASLMLVMQVVSGFMTWWKRRR
jgi:uncharacterized iron-regulated membrane protein